MVAVGGSSLDVMAGHRTQERWSLAVEVRGVGGKRGKYAVMAGNKMPSKAVRQDRTISSTGQVILRDSRT